MRRDRSALLEHQGLHALLLALLLLAARALAQRVGFPAGELLGLSSATWFVLCLAVPIVHQVYVAVCWRAELHLQLLTRVLGAPRGFDIYKRGFAVLFLSRFVTLIALAAATHDTLPGPRALHGLAAALVAAPGVYTIYSVRHYFGFERAVGVDHFDESYAARPFVREGVFRYLSNAMYTTGFLMFWAVALAFGSSLGLIVAGYAHAYIWVHYLCTERPDMRRIYGGG
ncbi:MAG: phosphatidylethanolamine N-methyltransferase family protein [Myxococcales bacterium]|nr:phosphatidylethanolamine N-methyltransferase family protein [Myxococcales bacterium]